MTKPRPTGARALLILPILLVFALLAAPAWAQEVLAPAPQPAAPPGGVLGGLYCRDLAMVLSLLEQRAGAFEQAADMLSDRPGEAAAQRAARARLEAGKARAEAAPLRRTQARLCDPTPWPPSPSQAVVAESATPPQPASQSIARGQTAFGAEPTPLPDVLDLPQELAGTNGWIISVSGTMARPWRSDPGGQEVRSELRLTLSDSLGLIRAEPTVHEVQAGLRLTMRLSCRSSALRSDVAFGFESAIQGSPERRYVADGTIAVTGPMALEDGVPVWPVRIRYGFSMQSHHESGIRFADGGHYMGEGTARRVGDIAARVADGGGESGRGCNG